MNNLKGFSDGVSSLAPVNMRAVHMLWGVSPCLMDLLTPETLLASEDS
jgi:hypothetical protein